MIIKADTSPNFMAILGFVITLIFLFGYIFSVGLTFYGIVRLIVAAIKKQEKKKYAKTILKGFLLSASIVAAFVLLNVVFSLLSPSHLF